MIDCSITIFNPVAGFPMPNRPDFDGLMRAVCTGYGYCGSLQDDGFVHVTDFFPERGRVTAEQFVDWLFMAEGDQGPMGSPSAMLMREKIRNCFIGSWAQITSTLGSCAISETTGEVARPSLVRNAAESSVLGSVAEWPLSCCSKF
ncbi:hypothetical protein NKJ71_30735 [Mesorhizobium sp. M0050]|uniref:hypothetical protein n=1 Tax=Mesorhizobium sp. M0050 TaxID=2956861 RepID=UPI003335EA23